MTRITLGGAVLRGTVSTALMASLMSASALGAPPVDLSKWSPEYVRSIAGTQDFDTAADCAQGHAARLQGAADFLVSGRVRGRPRPPAPVLQGFLRDLPQDLSEHPARGTGPHLQRPSRQVPHGAPGQCRADGGPPANPGWHRVRLKGLSAAAQARGCGVFDRGFLARRHEGRDLGRGDLRHSDQQRDDGVHLERRHLQACGPRSGQGSGNLGRRRQIFQADPRQARHCRLRPRGSQECRQHAVPLHAAALGLWRRRLRRSHREPDLQGGRTRQPAEQGGAASLLRHVCSRQVGSGFGTHQPAGRQPAACSSPASSA